MKLTDKIAKSIEMSMKANGNCKYCDEPLMADEAESGICEFCQDELDAGSEWDDILQEWD